MKFTIKHEISGRMRIHCAAGKLSYQQADTLAWFLDGQTGVAYTKIYERTGDVVIGFGCDRKILIQILRRFDFDRVEVPQTVLDSSSREMNACYQERLINKVLLHMGSKWLLPAPVRAVIVTVKSLKYIWNGLRSLAARKIEVAVLDATAIGVSILRGDTDTASSVMFLLGIGEVLEEWTHKKSVGDLARSMSLNISNVWRKVDQTEVLVKANTIQAGDQIVVHMGNVIPFDGVVVEGEGLINQSSLTGESLAVRKEHSGYVYAGTVLEEGELTLEVKQTTGSTRYEKIVAMIEDSEKLKSNLEGKAARLADRLVPYTLGGTGLVWLVTRDITRTLSVLMVDFSCALKLAIPITVLSAIREAGTHQITVKGGKYLEAVAEADTIVFDKTGTMTKARPTVKCVVPFCDMNERELLRIAACLEEHFPHSMAKAVIQAAKEQGLDHEEMHSRVDYIVAHGISSSIDQKKVVIGSAHFVFEDENCSVPEEYQDRFDELLPEYSHLYMAIDQKLAAVICIEDPLREETADVIVKLREAGFSRVVMMTGDSERTAASVAGRVGVDEYYSEVLPEDKASYIEKVKAAGHKVLMVGDGINDSPALSAANVGIAVSDGAEIAREIADITIAADDLYKLVLLKRLSNLLIRRIHGNYRNIVGFNAGLIALGVSGILQPTLSATFHNASTIAISLKSMTDLLPDDDSEIF